MQLPQTIRLTSRLIENEVVKIHPIGMTYAEAKEFRFQLHKKKYRLDKIEKILERIKGK